MVTGSNYRALEQFLDVQQDWGWDNLSFGPMLRGETDDWQKLNTAHELMPLTTQAIGHLVEEIGPRLAAQAKRLGLSVAGLPFGPTKVEWEANARGIYCAPEL